MAGKMTLYWWSKCSTCRNARRELEALDAEFSERDFFKEPLTEAELRAVCRLASADELFSWASPSAKKYRDRRGQLHEDQLIELMLSEPRLIRRPLVVYDSKLIIGFKRDEYRRLVG